MGRVGHHSGALLRTVARERTHRRGHRPDAAGIVPGRQLVVRVPVGLRAAHARRLRDEVVVRVFHVRRRITLRL